MQLDELYPTITKKEKNSSEIFNCGHITYSVNTFKIEYLGPGSIWAPHILNLLVSRRELLFDIKMLNFFYKQYKRFHCKIKELMKKITNTHCLCTHSLPV